MKPVPASLLAMIVAWALPLAGMALGQLVSSGRTADLGSTAFWVGLFALFGWAIAVAPFVDRFKGAMLISSLRWSRLGWSVVAAVGFSVLLIPIMGTVALQIVWYPAIMGCIAGFVFALLVRSRRHENR